LQLACLHCFCTTSASASASASAPQLPVPRRSPVALTLVLPADTLLPLSTQPAQQPPPITPQKIIPTRASARPPPPLPLPLPLLPLSPLPPPLHPPIPRLAPQCSSSRLALVAVSTALLDNTARASSTPRAPALPASLATFQHGLGSPLLIANHQPALGHSPNPLSPVTAPST
jgi:hypothetical protein